MSQIKHKHQILAAIDHLRARKSRPDINRISKFMLKFYKVSLKDTNTALKHCVKEKSIYKVDYKGNVSYRNASKWRKKSIENNTMSSVASSERRIITSAIATLIYQDQSNLENGIAFDDLVKVAASQQEPSFSKKQLETIVNKELNLGSLVKLPNGNLALGSADHDGDSSDSFRCEYTMDSNTKVLLAPSGKEHKPTEHFLMYKGNVYLTSSANSSCRSSPQRARGRPKKRGGGVSNSLIRNSGIRVGERRKMAKKVFDPSDNNIPNKRKRGRPVGSLNKSTIKKRLLVAGHSKSEKEGTPSEGHSFDGSIDEIDTEETMNETSGVCAVCLVQKSRNCNDRMIECRDCSNKAHLNCLMTASGLLRPRPDNTWLCQHCKTCVVCCETNDAGTLTVCSVCSDAYHSLCHAPRIPERLKGWDQWECANCLDSRPVLGDRRNGEYKQNSVMDPFLKPHELDRAPSKLRQGAPIDNTIPDISNWTVDDVFEYFADSFPEAAPLLKEQEFDGQALSMARRCDLVGGLGLPLGPALALYRIVVRLQTRRDDWTMCWG